MILLKTFEELAEKAGMRVVFHNETRGVIMRSEHDECFALTIARVPSDSENLHDTEDVCFSVVETIEEALGFFTIKELSEAGVIQSEEYYSLVEAVERQQDM